MEALTGNSMRNWFYHIVKFGRMGYAAKKDKFKGKIKEQGFTTIMVGYAANSATGMY